MKQHIEKLQNYSTIISNAIQNSLFNPGNMAYLNELDPSQEIEMTLPLSIFDDNPNVNSVIVGFRVNDDDYGEVEAYYRCVVQNRHMSDLIVVIDMPRGYSESASNFIDAELADALGHELQHSCETPDIMNVKIPEGEEKWKSVENVWKHFGSEVETKGYSTGFFLRALRLNSKGNDSDVYGIMEDYIIAQVYERGVQKGLNAELLQPIIKMIFEKWGKYMEKLIEAYYD